VTSPKIEAQVAKEEVSNPLFADKSWRSSPLPWPLKEDICNWIHDLSSAAIGFYQAIDLLYRKSWKGESVLRNENLSVPWVADYFDAGKPDWLVEHTRSESNRSLLPAVLRPDLIPHEDGIALTEWDSVPGGIGLTAQLEGLYRVDNDLGMVRSFGNALVNTAKHFGGKSANMVIAVSEEADTYFPEMQWICDKLKKLGFSIQACKTDDLEIKKGSLFLKSTKVDLVYRFWELFDHENVGVMHALTALVDTGEVVVTPPMKHIQEEKLSLALFHHHRLEPFWNEILGKKDLSILRSAIPKSWIIEPHKLPPGAYFDGPLSKGRKLTSWLDLGKASKKERRLVLKASGFHETAWGARSVVIGDDVSSDDWLSSITHSIDSYPSPIYVIQDFKKPRTFKHSVFDEQNNSNLESGRIRLSPYFFVNEMQANWEGTLATFCPTDKKIIHGMKDGVLMPCNR
jgi:hypothetical protein